MLKAANVYIVLIDYNNYVHNTVISYKSITLRSLFSKDYIINEGTYVQTFEKGGFLIQIKLYLLY